MEIVLASGINKIESITLRAWGNSSIRTPGCSGAAQNFIKFEKHGAFRTLDLSRNESAIILKLISNPTVLPPRRSRVLREPSEAVATLETHPRSAKELIVDYHRETVDFNGVCDYAVRETALAEPFGAAAMTIARQ